jgi:hypothetical protein
MKTFYCDIVVLHGQELLLNGKHIKKVMNTFSIWECFVIN